MKKILAFALVFMMLFTVSPLLGGSPFTSDIPDVVSAATGSSGGSGGGGGGGTTGTAPKAPTLLVLNNAGATTVTISWKDNATNESGFKVERVVKGGAAWTQVASTAKDTATYTDTAVKPETTYFYRIKAWNSYGTSASSNELIVTTAKGSVVVPVTPTYSNTPSSWATAEIELAKTAELTVDTLLSEYNKPITRAEFSELVVKIYEKATGKAIVPASPNPFTDTQSEAVLKAYAVGIIKGVSADKFAPNANVTRQEMAVMLQRELKSANPEGNYDVSAEFKTVFADEANIASWAIDAVRFMNESGIVNGVGDGKIDPKGNATREQAMLMVYRDYVKFVAAPVEAPAQ